MSPLAEHLQSVSFCIHTHPLPCWHISSEKFTGSSPRGARLATSKGPCTESKNHHLLCVTAIPSPPLPSALGARWCRQELLSILSAWAAIKRNGALCKQNGTLPPPRVRKQTQVKWGFISRNSASLGLSHDGATFRGNYYFQGSRIWAWVSLGLTYRPTICQGSFKTIKGPVNSSEKDRTEKTQCIWWTHTLRHYQSLQLGLSKQFKRFRHPVCTRMDGIWAPNLTLWKFEPKLFFIACPIECKGKSEGLTTEGFQIHLKVSLLFCIYI